MTFNQIIQLVGVPAGSGFVIILLWSALFPSHRIWPPQHYSRFTAVVTWVGTLAIFGPALWLGLTGWGSLGLPDWLRFGPGLLAVLLGNAFVWPAAFRFGFDQTSGDTGQLMTTGLYRYSRHPQYVADMLMLTGWAVLTASGSALPVITAGIAALAAAPFAEEPWLRETYGAQYDAYCKRTPRFIGVPRETGS